MARIEPVTFQRGSPTKLLAQDRWANPPPVGKAMVAGVREAMMLVYKGCGELTSSEAVVGHCESAASNEPAHCGKMMYSPLLALHEGTRCE